MSFQISDFLIANQDYIVLSLIFGCVVLFILCISLLVSHIKLKKRIQLFMGKRGEKHHIEEMLIQYLDEVKEIHEHYQDVLDAIKDLDKRLNYCVQKIGFVRYNPFSEMGGDLCFALAMLDGNHDGIVISTIFGRESAYTYGKSVVGGESKYPLSEEEVEAIDIAMNQKAEDK